MIDFDNSDLRRVMNHLARVWAEAENGKALKRETSKQLRQIMRPLVQERRSSVLRLPSKGHSGPSMRQAIARQIRAATRWKGKSTGVSVIQRSRGMPRQFNMAGRAFNRPEGWQPTTLGGEQIHQEVSPEKWFDKHAESDGPMARRQLIEAIEGAAATMADEIRRIR